MPVASAAIGARRSTARRMRAVHQASSMTASGARSSRRSEISERGLQSACPSGRPRGSSTGTTPASLSGREIRSLRKIQGCPAAQRWAPRAETTAWVRDMGRMLRAQGRDRNRREASQGRARATRAVGHGTRRGGRACGCWLPLYIDVIPPPPVWTARRRRIVDTGVDGAKSRPYIPRPFDERRAFPPARSWQRQNATTVDTALQ